MVGVRSAMQGVVRHGHSVILAALLRARWLMRPNVSFWGRYLRLPKRLMTRMVYGLYHPTKQEQQ